MCEGRGIICVRRGGYICVCGGGYICMKEGGLYICKGRMVIYV